MDYRDSDPYPTGDTPGLIVDGVSHCEQLDTDLPIRSFDSSGHA